MGFISTILGSSVIVMLAAFFCAVFCIRSLLYGVMGGTSTILRIVTTIIFAFLAYYFWKHAMSMHGPNMIDDAVYEVWYMVRGFLSQIRHSF